MIEIAEEHNLDQIKISINVNSLGIEYYYRYDKDLIA